MAKVVTPEQLEQGFYFRDGVNVTKAKFKVVGVLPNGNYLVEEPITLKDTEL